MNKKLWKNKKTFTSEKITNFLSKDDVKLDNELFLYDIKATKAHIKGLKKINIISHAEYTDLNKQLNLLSKDFKNKKFKLDSKYEDGHSAIEIYLTKHLGDVGAKVHTGRSRNDQVQVALRLYSKEMLKKINKINLKINGVLIQKAKKTSSIKVPGYTHIQKATPSTWGLWFGSFAESFNDNILIIDQTIKWINSNPLGGAAGYGVNLPLDRELSAKELGFERIQINSLYTQNSRGKYELQIISALKQCLLDIRKFSWDLSIYLSQEFDYLDIGDDFKTGSSIMPNKNNPDVVEILRANYSILCGCYSELETLLSLPSGYHRDLQLSKKSLIEAFQVSIQTLDIFLALIKTIKINKIKSESAIDKEMMMTNKVYGLVSTGIPFRDAYHMIKNNEVDVSTNDSFENFSYGSPFNLAIEDIESRFIELKKLILS